MSSAHELHELAERESKAMTDEIARLKQELEALKNDLEEGKEISRKKNAENDFKLKYATCISHNLFKSV